MDGAAVGRSARLRLSVCRSGRPLGSDRQLWVRPLHSVLSSLAGRAAPAAGPIAWADVDGPWTAQRAQALDRLGGWPTWQVHSGSGRHLYLPLGELEPPARLEGWNRRLAALLQADSGWSETKLLRLPGTYNHKPRTAGGRSRLVRWL